jgi:hypothetical protein
MKNNEIKWAIGIGIVMITICIIAIMIAKGSSKEINLKVYKLNMIGESYKDYTKEPCKMSTDNLVTINKEFKKAFKIGESKKVANTNVMGKYQLIDGESIVAFDDKQNGKLVIYRTDGKNSGVYEFDSTLYELVQRVCG